AFKMNKGDTTDVVTTKTGFLILQVREHYAAGLQPEDKVDNEIMSRLYDDKMRPALRDYLDTLRQDSYVDVKPGYVDSAAVAGTKFTSALSWAIAAAASNAASGITPKTSPPRSTATTSSRCRLASKIIVTSCSSLSKKFAARHPTKLSLRISFRTPKRMSKNF